MEDIPQLRQLVVRRRRDDGIDHSKIWVGYDEFIGHTPTGKIVLSWRYENGEAIYEYASEPPEGKSFWEKEFAPTAELPSAETVDLKPAHQETPEVQKMDALAMFDGADERYLISFDWEYGHEEVAVRRLEDAAPTRKAIEEKYKSFTFTNWAVRKEVYLIEEVDLWRPAKPTGPRVCPLCKGKKTVTQIDAIHADGTVTNPRPANCMACDGTGEVETEEV